MSKTLVKPVPLTPRDRWIAGAAGGAAAAAGGIAVYVSDNEIGSAALLGLGALLLLMTVSGHALQSIKLGGGEAVFGGQVVEELTDRVDDLPLDQARPLVHVLEKASAGMGQEEPEAQQAIAGFRYKEAVFRELDGLGFATSLPSEPGSPLDMLVEGRIAVIAKHLPPGRALDLDSLSAAGLFGRSLSRIAHNRDVTGIIVVTNRTMTSEASGAVTPVDRPSRTATETPEPPILAEWVSWRPNEAPLALRKAVQFMLQG